MNTIELNETYHTENGQDWLCIAIKGDVAWLVGMYDGKPNGVAYSWCVDGTPICLRLNHSYSIKFEPVVEWVEVRGGFTTGSLENATVHPEYADHKFTLKVPFIDGKPDFTQATVTPV